MITLSGFHCTKLIVAYFNKTFLIVNRIQLQLKVATEVQIKDSFVNEGVRASVKYFVGMELVFIVKFGFTPSQDFD